MEPIKPPQRVVAALINTSEPEIKTMPDKYIGAPLKNVPKVQEKVVVVEKVQVIERKISQPTAPVPSKKRGLPKWPIVALLFVLLAGVGAFYYLTVIQKAPEPVVVPTPLPPTPAPPPVPEPEPAPPPPPPVVETGPKKGVDTDSDGLTDAEEVLYGSIKTNPDSDSDGFLDGVEVFHLYNPAGQAPVRLLDTGSVKVYVNANYKYQIYVPGPWKIEQVVANGSDVKFIDGGESVEVTIEDNPAHLALVNWYLSKHSSVKPSELQTFITKSNLDGVKGPDGRTAYIATDGQVYVITYNLAQEEIMNYLATFEMMLNSFIRAK